MGNSIKVKMTKGMPIDAALKVLREKMEVNGVIDSIKAHRYRENKPMKARRKNRSRKQRTSVAWTYVNDWD